MTLTLTELSAHGVAMAADTALTKNAITYDGSKQPRIYHGVIKLHPIKALSAGISFYGDGLIEDADTELWVSGFIRNEARNHETMSSFGTVLAGKLNTIIKPSKILTLGFDLAGFEKQRMGTSQAATRYSMERAMEHSAAFQNTRQWNTNKIVSRTNC